MAVNKVVLGERTLIDLSLATATEADVAKGKYFHRADGEIVEGTLEGSGGGGSGGGGLVERDVNFYDYDGTLLYAYPRVAALEMTELPAPPTHEGLPFQEWNWTLDEIKSVDDQIVYVGAIYTTDDGKTRLYIDIGMDLQKTVNLCICEAGGGNVTVNWGDGTDEETYDISNQESGSSYYTARPTHVYENVGEYIITLHSTSTGLHLGYDSYSVFNKSDTNGNSVVYQKILKKVEFGSSVSFISPKAFYNCSQLETITMHKNVTTSNQRNSLESHIGYCNSLKHINLPRNFNLSKNCFIGCLSLEIVSLPGTATILNEYVFSKCTSLKKLTIPPRISHLCKGCFSNTLLTRLVLPKTLNYVEASAISYMNLLEEIVIKAERPTTWKTGAEGCRRLKTFKYPSTATEIQSNAFNNCSLLESIDIPTGVKSVGGNAFQNCNSIEEIHLPDSVTSIGSSAFYGCGSLGSVNIPEGVSIINGSTFYRCWALTSLEIPQSVTSIGTQAFYNCTNMKYIDFSRHTAVPTLSGSNAFNGTSKLEIRVPSALYDEWIAATNWSSVASKIVAV